MALSDKYRGRKPVFFRLWAGVQIALLALLTVPASAEETQITIDETVSYQTVESFGASGCWWSQYMGLWEEPYGDAGRSAREELGMLLYDRENGIGLTNYRYNLGSGSADSGKGSYSDIHRRAQSFETAPGEYDWSKDEGAVWFLNEVTRLGAREVALFCNSPLERLTLNGTAQMIKGKGRSNISRENYAAWAAYCCDVAEHFLQMGVPVKFLSPINEPQWDWYEGNQEGCHYEPAQTVEVYKAFLEELNSRPALAGVELSGPESGEWGGRTLSYVSALLNDPTLNAHFSAVDCHSYWSDTSSKSAFRKWLNVNYPGKQIRMSEWCEMVNGTDTGMDSAIVLAQTVAEDLSVLDAVSWSCWVGVSPGGYHDGLIHAVKNGRHPVTIMPLKRLWAYGNYSRFIRPGFVRVAVEDGKALNAVAFKGEEEGRKKLVVVAINDSTEALSLCLNGDFSAYASVTAYETSAQYDLGSVGQWTQTEPFTLSPRSVTTFVFSE